LNKKISDKDKKDWQNFISSTEKVNDKDQQNLKNYISFTEKTIDLHGFSLEDANKEIEKFIFSCFEKGVKKINIITGKGSRSKNTKDPFQSRDLSILKFSVPSFIKENENLMKMIKKIDFDSVESVSKGSFGILLRKKID
tara:strand:- start:3500 stop:3919 length:420 start_codon:yes stop_codon:yes gene_type:complete